MTSKRAMPGMVGIGLVLMLMAALHAGGRPAIESLNEATQSLVSKHVSAQ